MKHSKARKIKDLSRQAEEALVAARLKACGLSMKVIGERLGCSHQKAFRLVHVGIDAYREKAREETAQWVEKAIAELIQASQEAWIEWEKSKQDHQRRTVKTNAEGTETTEMVEGQCGDPRYLDQVCNCIEKIGKLRGVITSKVDVTQQTAIINQPPGEPSRFKQQLAGILGSMLPPALVDAHLFGGNDHPAPLVFSDDDNE